MGVRSQIVCGRGRGARACVTDWGELAVGQILPDVAINTEITAANTAFNLLRPDPQSVLRITGFIFVTDKTVGPDGAIIELYECIAEDSTSVERLIFKTELQKSDKFVLTGVQMLSNPSKWLNVKATDVNVFITVLHHHIYDFGVFSFEEEVETT